MKATLKRKNRISDYRKLFSLITFIFMVSFLFAQPARPKLTVLNIDSQNLNMTPEQMGNLVRIEVDKLDTFEVTDRYDVKFLLEKHNLDISNCYGKICLVEHGKVIGSDFMLGGSIERFGEVIIFTLRLIDVQKEVVLRTSIREFLNLPLELQTMARVSIREMFGLRNDPDLVIKLTKPHGYESMITNPDVNAVNLAGPRMGWVFYSGQTAETFKSPKDQGGYDIYPSMFQIGWQFEKQYLNAGSYQALVEFIPLISGLDQNMAIPSFTILNGFRNNRLGIELAVGPTVNFVRMAKGYYDENQKWQLEKSWDSSLGPNPFPVSERLDSRGAMYLRSGFVLAAGWTYKSGRLNIPLNAFFIPSRSGGRIGISMGYNARKN